MKKESFLSILTSYNKEDLNNFIKQNGNRKKPTKPLIYPNVSK